VGSAGRVARPGREGGRGRAEQLAEQIGSRGADELKRRATEAVNERLRPVRNRRSELTRDRGYLRTVLRDGSAAARSIAQSTLKQVAAAMHTHY
jgi:tryptophanyl-tRNA synthetase